MSAGARKAAPGPANPLTRFGGAALAVALLATVAVLMVFGDRLVGGRPGGRRGQERRGRGHRPEVAAAQRDEVVDAASAVLTTWSQPELGYDAWWAGLKPLLTPGGREAYSFTDPAQVPQLADLTADHVVLNPSGATATVWFETSDGRVRRRPLPQGRDRQVAGQPGRLPGRGVDVRMTPPLPAPARAGARPRGRAGVGRAGGDAVRRRLRGRADRSAPARPPTRARRPRRSGRPRSGPGTSGRAPSPPCRPASGWSRRPRARSPRRSSRSPVPSPAPGGCWAARPAHRPWPSRRCWPATSTRASRRSGSTRTSRRSRAGRRSRRASPCTGCSGPPTRSATRPHWPPAVRMLASFSPSEARAVESLVSAGGRAPSRCYAAASDVSALPLPPGTSFEVKAPKADRHERAERRTGPAVGGRDAVRGRLRDPGRRGHRGQGHRHPGQHGPRGHG